MLNIANDERPLYTRSRNIYKEEFKSPTLTHIIPGDEGGCVGITSLNGQLFVLRKPCGQIEVYSTSTFELQRTIRVDGLGDAYSNGLTSCRTNKCIYVSDYIGDTVVRVDLTDGDKLVKWKVDSPRGLSVNAACNVIVTCHDGVIVEYTTRGSMVRKILLSSDVSDTWHAIQLINGHFVVSHRQPVDGVSIADSRGQLVTNYSGDQSTQLLKAPGNLAVAKNDCILVVDSDDNRIVVLNSSLSCARVLPLPIDGGLEGPWCLHFDESRGRLYVGECGGKRAYVCDDVSISSVFIVP